MLGGRLEWLIKRMVFIYSAPLPFLHPVSAFSSNSTCFSASANNTLWHLRLGHMSYSRMSLLQEVILAANIHSQSHCEICPLAKQHRSSFPLSSIKTSKPFDMIHCDIWGPFATTTSFGHKYFLTVVDDYTRCTWVYLMINNAKTRWFLESFFQLVETQFNSTIEVLWSDNGLKFNLPSFFASKGNIHQLSCTYTPQ